MVRGRSAKLGDFKGMQIKACLRRKDVIYWLGIL